jgi:two-component system cell cycle response regulator
VRIGDMGSLRVTVSIGLATSADANLPCVKDALSDLIGRADRALLSAKSAGRNQVTISRTAA